MEVKEDVSVKQYFEELVPQIFAEQINTVIISGMEGTRFALSFNIQNGTAQTYSVLITDAKDVEVVTGPVDSPTVNIFLTEDTWRQAVTGKLAGAMELFTDAARIANRSMYERILSTAGTLALDLARSDGDNVALKIVFNGAEKPEVTFRCAVDDWMSIVKGELDGMNAFMSGKMKIDGDMMFAMSLNSLM